MATDNEMTTNNDTAAAQGNNDRPKKIRIKFLPRGSRSGSQSSSASSAKSAAELETTVAASILMTMKNYHVNPEERSLTVSPVSAANNSSSSPDDKASKDPSPNKSSSSPDEKTSKDPSPSNTSGKKKKKPASAAKTKTSKRRNSDMTANWPPCPYDKADHVGIALWRQGCESCIRPDGTVDGLDVANWLMTRRGGVANPWTRLEENQAAVKAMGRQRIDPLKILQQQEEEARVARLKEERRQANKLRYRPRGQIAKEKAERAAAAAAAAAEKAAEEAQEETSGANKRPLNDETEDENEEPQAKKAKLDAVA
ncbi:hypothetical protein BHE90_008086 [Fusarium euwallaceae]|uniref:Uncharacterized protein n=3 Tax=Fusarium solani species complex TaxID=232080 RepID=A0A3M2RYR6_9HYPO|nr:hypothetical protein CDV36_010137 [Fusarium kuroshium]RSL77722.1 hypothetical protein CEP51_008825 [Fusarium floridanum]RTE77433.1 hypothetical protein BHE90_008086 [Fusarium euwallaceae]